MILAGLTTIVNGLTGEGGMGVEEWTLAFTSISGGIALLFTRDNSVSSEDAGIK